MKWVTFLFTLFILAVIVFADLGILPKFLGWAYDFPNGDKVGHFILFGLLNFFLTLTFTRPRHNWTPSTRSPQNHWDYSGQRRERVALSISLALSLLIAVEEFSQLWFSARSFDLIDLLMSFVGVAVGGWIAFKINR
jgi:VanZ family protein